MDSFMKEFEHLVIKLEDIKSATNNFDETKVIGSGGFGKVYKGEVSHYKGRSMVAFKRLDRKFGQGDPEFWKEIMMLSRYTHENLISLLGYCNEGGEMILVYEHASNGSLDRHLSSTTLTWTQRIMICLDAARGLSYLHDDKGTQQRVLHRDIKSPNILLDENWNVKVSDMGLSKLGPANQQHTALMTNVVGTPGYCDPLYMELGYLTKESDVYSFGVVLLEVLFGRLCFENVNKQFRLLVHAWKKSCEENNLDQFIFHCLKQQMDSSSLRLFSDVAFECLKRSRDERPRMADVVAKLEIALAEQKIYEKVKLPTDYKEIIKTAVPTLNYGSEEELKRILLKGTLLNSGQTWFAVNMNGKHYEMISIAECLDLRASECASFSSKYRSRFSWGSYIPPHKTFRTCVEPQLLSPNVTYIMNLVFKKKQPSELYIGLEYEFKGETYYSFLSDEREDGWSTAELFQFTTNQRETVDKLNILFNIEYCDIKAVEGIEFQPLEEVEHGVLVSNQVDTQASDTNWKESLQTVDKHGQKFIMLPTRVALKDDGWTWKYLPKTRFEEVPQDPLSKFCISCNIESKILSGDTTYAAYHVYKQKAYNFQPAPAQVEDKNSHVDETLDIYLQSPQTPVIISGEVCQDTLNQSHRPNIRGLPQLRRDGWMEVQIWEFKTNRNTTKIPMDVELSSYDERSLKRLEAKGIEFRPRKRN